MFLFLFYLMYNIKKGCDKLMAINWAMEKPSGYGVVDYDGLWKKLIYELFEEFMLFFAPDLYEEIDFLKEPEFLQQELFQEIMQEKKGKQVADQIVKVFLKNGEEKWILIHIEVLNLIFQRECFVIIIEFLISMIEILLPLPC